jgi:hypothetical protein
MCGFKDFLLLASHEIIKRERKEEEKPKKVY